MNEPSLVKNDSTLDSVEDTEEAVLVAVAVATASFDTVVVLAAEAMTSL